MSDWVPCRAYAISLRRRAAWFAAITQGNAGPHEPSRSTSDLTTGSVRDPQFDLAMHDAIEHLRRGQRLQRNTHIPGAFGDEVATACEITFES